MWTRIIFLQWRPSCSFLQGEERRVSETPHGKWVGGRWGAVSGDRRVLVLTMALPLRSTMGHVCNGGVPPVCPGLASSGQSHLEQEEQGLLWERASLVAQMVKNLPTMREAWVWALGQEDPLEKGMDTHSSMLAWRIPWTEKPGGLQSMGSQRVGHDWVTHTHTYTPAEKGPVP